MPEVQAELMVDGGESVIVSVVVGALGREEAAVLEFTAGPMVDGTEGVDCSVVSGVPFSDVKSMTAAEKNGGTAEADEGDINDEAVEGIAFGVAEGAREGEEAVVPEVVEGAMREGAGTAGLCDVRCASRRGRGYAGGTG